MSSPYKRKRPILSSQSRPKATAPWMTLLCWSTESLSPSVTLLSLFMQKLPIDQGIELLQAVLGYETKDPLILSCVLTNISALFPFVTHRPNILPQVLTKVSSANHIPEIQ